MDIYEQTEGNKELTKSKLRKLNKKLGEKFAHYSFQLHTKKQRHASEWEINTHVFDTEGNISMEIFKTMKMNPERIKPYALTFYKNAHEDTNPLIKVFFKTRAIQLQRSCFLHN